MILFWRETQDGSFSAQDLRPAGAAAGVHAAAPLHAGAGPGGVRLAKRGARRHAGPGAVRAGHAGKHHGLCPQGPVHRRMAGQPPWRVSHRALLRAQRTQLCGLHGCAAHRVGALGQCGQRHRPRRLSRQRPATAHAGSSAAAFPEKITHIGATVSPQNQYSLHNALASGFAIVSRREMYGGHDRYLLAKDL